MNATIKVYLLAITAAASISLCLIIFKKLPEHPFFTSLTNTEVQSLAAPVYLWGSEELSFSKPSVILFISSCIPGYTCMQVIDKHQWAAEPLSETPLAHYVTMHLAGDVRRLFTFAGSI